MKEEEENDCFVWFCMEPRHPMTSILTSRYCWFHFFINPYPFTTKSSLAHTLDEL